MIGTLRSVPLGRRHRTHHDGERAGSLFSRLLRLLRLGDVSIDESSSEPPDAVDLGLELLPMDRF